MPLALKEIRPGVVAYFDVDILVHDPAVTYSEHGANFRSGPFLCAEQKDGRSLWLQITKRRDDKKLRLELDTDWRREGSPLWRKGLQFIHDARKPFIGPDESFVAAAVKQDTFDEATRPYIVEPGITVVLAEIDKYGAPRL